LPTITILGPPEQFLPCQVIMVKPRWMKQSAGCCPVSDQNNGIVIINQIAKCKRNALLAERHSNMTTSMEASANLDKFRNVVMIGLADAHKLPSASMSHWPLLTLSAATLSLSACKFKCAFKS
jgi:hypothetical protein